MTKTYHGNKIGHPYYSYDKYGNIALTPDGKPIINYNVELPEIIIIPDSKKSPGERAVLERYRRLQYANGIYNAKLDKELTELDIAKSQNQYNNSTLKKALDTGQTIASGLGVVSDIISGVPVYSTLKGVTTLVRAETPKERLQGALWLSPAMFGTGKLGYKIGKSIYNQEGALWDKYTTFRGRFGNYGDNLFTNMYGTFARRFGLPDKARLPADAIRKIKDELLMTKDGKVILTGKRDYLDNPHINITVDRPVVSHNNGNWDNSDTYLFPLKDFINKTKNGALKSIEPSDVFANGSDITIAPSKVTVISGDANVLEKAKAAGMQTLSSPKLRRIFETENKNYQKALSSASSPLMKSSVKPPRETLGLSYATEMQRLQSMRGTPTLKDFRLLERQTGLNAGVAPISEYFNAINSLKRMMNADVLDVTDGIVKPYVYPNGRVVDFTPRKIKQELDLIEKANYNHVFYDPATFAESLWLTKVGLE